MHKLQKQNKLKGTDKCGRGMPSTVDPRRKNPYAVSDMAAVWDIGAAAEGVPLRRRLASLRDRIPRLRSETLKKKRMIKGMGI